MNILGEEDGGNWQKMVEVAGPRVVGFYRERRERVDRIRKDPNKGLQRIYTTIKVMGHGLTN